MACRAGQAAALRPCRCARCCSDPGAACIAILETKSGRPCQRSQKRLVPVSGDRGLGIIPAAPERARLATRPASRFRRCVALRFTSHWSFAPTRSPPRPPATPDAGPMNATARNVHFGWTAAPIAHLRFAWCPVARRAAVVRKVAGGCALLGAAAPPAVEAVLVPVVPARAPGT